MPGIVISGICTLCVRLSGIPEGSRHSEWIVFIGGGENWRGARLFIERIIGSMQAYAEKILNLLELSPLSRYSIVRKVIPDKISDYFDISPWSNGYACNQIRSWNFEIVRRDEIPIWLYFTRVARIYTWSVCNNFKQILGMPANLPFLPWKDSSNNHQDQKVSAGTLIRILCHSSLASQKSRLCALNWTIKSIAKILKVEE